MNWKIVLILLLVVLGVGTWARFGRSSADEPDKAAVRKTPPRIITVTGRGKVKVDADTAVIYFTFSVQPTFELSQQETKKLTDALEALKIPGLQVTVPPVEPIMFPAPLAELGGTPSFQEHGGIRMTPSQQPAPELPPPFVPAANSPPPANEADGDKTQKAAAAPVAEKTPERPGLQAPDSLVNQKVMVSVTAAEPNQLRDLVNRVLNASRKSGATTMPECIDVSPNRSFLRPSTRFYRQDLSGAHKTAYTQALQDALTNARTLAAGAKVSIIDTIVIQDDGNNAPGVEYLRQNPNGLPSDAFGSIGEFWLVQQVKITCAY